MSGIKKLHNPFVTTGYVSPDYFCDRENESKQILDAIQSHRSMALISLRRMGKTGLLKHVQYLLKAQNKNNELIYIDLMPTQSSADLLSMLGTALLQLKSKEKNILAKILETLSALRPGFSYDNLTGQPSVIFSVVTENDFHIGLRQLLALFNTIKKELTIVLDEFQQILEYPEKNTEHLIRTIVQENPQITFLFSGSNKHMMEAMFSSATRPFYQSTELMYLGPIDTNSYSAFISNLFNASRFDFNKDTIIYMLDWCRNHTFYVQHFCNRLFSKANHQKIDEIIVRQVSFEIIASFEPLYLTYRKLLTAPQFALIQAIAAENGISKPLSGIFIQKYSLKSASSVKTSLDALESKELLINVNNTWLVYDVFFARWLEHNWKLLNL